MMHRCRMYCPFCSSFLSNFRLIRPQQNILFDPPDDGRVITFFTGGWMERYVLQMVKQVVARSQDAWSDEQALLGAQVVLPNQANSEFDLLVGLASNCMLWIECKTGEWQDYVARFQTINRQFMRLPAKQAALVLLEQLGKEDGDSASTLTGMSVLHLTELSSWLEEAIGSAASTDTTQPSVS